MTINTSKKIGLGIIVVIVVFLALVFTSVALTDEETKQKWEEKREEKEHQEIFERTEQQKQEELQKEIDNFESVVNEKNILLYRPYWLVGNEWDEKERLGFISKSDECTIVVSVINDVQTNVKDQNILFNDWMELCVTIP